MPTHHVCLFIVCTHVCYTEFNTGMVLWIQQFYGLFVKRFLHSLRNWKAIITQLILPILFVIFGLVLVQTVPEVTSEDEQRQLSMRQSSLLDDNIITFFAEFGSGSDVVFKVKFCSKDSCFNSVFL